MKKTPIFIQF
jgi:hypothetical protein